MYLRSYVLLGSPRTCVLVYVGPCAQVYLSQAVVCPHSGYSFRSDHVCSLSSWRDVEGLHQEVLGTGGDGRTWCRTGTTSGKWEREGI